MLSHTIDRLRCTDRQLLGFGVLLASCHVLGTRQGSCHHEIPAPTLSRPLPGHPDILLCLSSRASAASRGISNPEPLPSCGKGTCLGADDTKEFLSFGKQPSLFKGRNQSWFHPLRTPSRPGAAAPGPHGGLGAIVGAFACHLPAAMHRPPAARFYHPIVFVLFFENKAKFCLP